MKYLDMIKQRRSYYDIVEGETPDNETLKQLIGDILTVTPDAFNVQAPRLVLLLDDESRKFWDKVNATFDNSLDEAKFAGFKNAKGTVLFFTDEDSTEKLMDQFPDYAQNFPVWAEHAVGMIQLNVWNALRQLELGASLQHYNPVIDEWVKADYDIPESWKLTAQMPFGAIGSEPDAKPKLDVSERMKVIG